ncbi:hypothetical protein [Marinovum sp.]|uniref:hypothetical protein n=1 Tax=Marinovum sp. TaxID=2024839 RepID=UPI002B274DBE|nr:hypothetical protein [Marinovum sp.]
MDTLKTLLSNAELVELLLAGIGVVLTLLINRAAGALEAATGIRIDAAHREALHSAIRSGIEAALEEGPEAGLGDIKAAAIAYAHRSVPGAIRALVPGEGVLDALALRYYREAMQRAGFPAPELML